MAPSIFPKRLEYRRPIPLSQSARGLRVYQHKNATVFPITTLALNLLRRVDSPPSLHRQAAAEDPLLSTKISIVVGVVCSLAALGLIAYLTTTLGSARPREQPVTMSTAQSRGPFMRTGKLHRRQRGEGYLARSPPTTSRTLYYRNMPQIPRVLIVPPAGCAINRQRTNVHEGEHETGNSDWTLSRYYGDFSAEIARIFPCTVEAAHYLTRRETCRTSPPQYSTTVPTNNGHDRDIGNNNISNGPPSRNPSPPPSFHENDQGDALPPYTRYAPSMWETPIYESMMNYRLQEQRNPSTARRGGLRRHLRRNGTVCSNTNVGGLIADAGTRGSRTQSREHTIRTSQIAFGSLDASIAAPLVIGNSENSTGNDGVSEASTDASPWRRRFRDFFAIDFTAVSGAIRFLPPPL